MLGSGARYRRFQDILRGATNFNAHFQQNTRRQGVPITEPGNGQASQDSLVPTGPLRVPPIRPPSRSLAPSLTAATDAPSTQTQTSIADTVPPVTPTTESNESTTAADVGDATKDSGSASSEDSNQGLPNTSSNLSTLDLSTSASVSLSRLGVAAFPTVTESTFSMTTQVVTQTSIVTRNDREKTPLIAGTVIGAIALLSVSIWVALTWWRRYLSKARQRRSSRSDDIAPFTMSSPTQNPVNKLGAERERIRAYALGNVDHDHQEGVDDRDSDEEELGVEGTGR
ncbi:hypothetical protein E1B28_009530 [Marasmius oreades]|uniref:Mid2 domain-containing protein n=1 Tax=Marasmius oreades TaxID=181124 RepID=A0A9P7UQU4_9AGAR|nr:uncharacterized protein E1B28_009530 [Marasmius oreades]KAG7090410.1 hypothetical protein E1B28_009530 [Marasmius oreades]